MSVEPLFNPLDKENLGFSVTKAMLDRIVSPLPPTSEFRGAGLYAIYYVGDYPEYEPVATKNRDGRFEAPIYVGKAIPSGGRKGSVDPTASPGKALFRRLSEHAESIRLVENLDLNDFFCRYLVVDDIWIPLAESLLIRSFQPIWNIVIDGYGNHDPGGGRYNQKKARWDVLHPGRLWASKLKDNAKSVVQIHEILSAFHSGKPAEILETPEI